MGCKWRKIVTYWIASAASKNHTHPTFSNSIFLTGNFSILAKRPCACITDYFQCLHRLLILRKIGFLKVQNKLYLYLESALLGQKVLRMGAKITFTHLPNFWHPSFSIGFKEFILSSKIVLYSVLVLGSNSQMLNSIYFYQKIAIRPSSTPFCRHVIMPFKGILRDVKAK